MESGNKFRITRPVYRYRRLSSLESRENLEISKSQPLSILFLSHHIRRTNQGTYFLLLFRYLTYQPQREFLLLKYLSNWSWPRDYQAYGNGLILRREAEAKWSRKHAEANLPAPEGM